MNSKYTSKTGLGYRFGSPAICVGLRVSISNSAVPMGLVVYAY